MQRNSELYRQIRLKLESNWCFQNDKPEETIESTVDALWHKASGSPVSAKIACEIPLPSLTDQQRFLLHQLLDQRIDGIPLAYLTGRQNFMGLELICDQRALIPRKETEILGHAAIEICTALSKSDALLKVMDVCCGSGNLGIVLASKFPDLKVYSSDLSVNSVKLTKENVKFQELDDRVNVRQSDLFSAFETDYYLNNMDLIVCNPPYISTSKVSKMNQEIQKNEPQMAFDGGMIGLKIIQRLIKEAPAFLKKNGSLIFEVGLGQGEFVVLLCEKSKLYTWIKTFNDLSGNIRVIAAGI